MALNQNQFALTTTAGTKTAGTNIRTCEFYSATATDTIAPGTAVAISSTVNGLVTKVAKGADTDGAWYGVVLTNPLKDSYAVGEKVEVAFALTDVLMTASAAITAGASVMFDPATGKVATKTSTHTVLGVALENAAADGDLIRVQIVAGLV